MDQKRLTTKEAAEAVGVSPNTLKHWLKDLPINPDRDQAGKFRFDARALEVLEAVKQLRDNGRSYETIRRHIGPTDHPEVAQESPGIDPGSLEADPEVAPESPRSDLTLAQVINDAVTQAIERQTVLAEKYAHAAHRIGDLEATLRERDRELTEARDKVALLQAGEDNREQLERDLAAAKSKVADLEAMVARQARPWWRPW